MMPGALAPSSPFLALPLLATALSLGPSSPPITQRVPPITQLFHLLCARKRPPADGNWQRFSVVRMQGVPGNLEGSGDGDVSRAGKKLAKIHASTVALIPPDEAWDQLQALRYELQDKGLYRWPPHVNLLYPFLVESHIPLVLSKLRTSLREVQPFQVTLQEFGLFVHKKSATLWLRPDITPDPLALDRLQQALQDAVPDCHEQRSSFAGRFTPHMTVTHFDTCNDFSISDCEDVRQRLQATWQPVTFTCSQVHVMTRQGAAGQFRCRAKLFLGSGDSQALATLIDEPYKHMPTEAPPFCNVSKASPSSRAGGKTQRGRQRKPRTDLPPLPEGALEKLQDPEVATQVAARFAPLIGQDRALAIRSWLSSGAYLCDEDGFVLHDMSDRALRTQVHQLINQEMRPIVADTVDAVDAMTEKNGNGGEEAARRQDLRLRIPKFAKDAMR